MFLPTFGGFCWPLVSLCCKQRKPCCWEEWKSFVLRSLLSSIEHNASGFQSSHRRDCCCLLPRLINSQQTANRIPDRYSPPRRSTWFWGFMTINISLSFSGSRSPQCDAKEFSAETLCPISLAKIVCLREKCPEQYVLSNIKKTCNGWLVSIQTLANLCFSRETGSTCCSKDRLIRPNNTEPAIGRYSHETGHRYLRVL